MHLLLVMMIFMTTNQFICTLTGNDANHTSKCIVQIVHLVGKRKIALEFTEEDQDIVNEVLQKVNVPVVLNSVEQRIPTEIELRTSVDVLFILKKEKPRKILNDTLWNYDTRFVIVTQDEETVEYYFEQFWKLKVINVFGMVVEEGNITLYSFLPYGKKNCTKPELIVVDSCMDGKLQNGGTALKDTMRIKNMNKCPVNITITQARPSLIFEPVDGKNSSSTAKGFEGRFILEVAKAYNFSATFKIADDGIGWGWIHPSPRGAIGDLWLGVCEITVGVLAPFLERYQYLDLAYNYNMDECITFAVPQGYGAKQAAWLTIFVLEYTYYTWSLIVFSFLVVLLNVWLINRYLSVNWFGSNTEIALFLFSSCVGMPIKTPQFVSSRMSVLFWIIFTFIVTVAYRASMGSKLTVPPQDVDITNFKELLDSDLEIIGLKNMIQILKTTDEWPFAELRNRFHITNDYVDHMVERIAIPEKISFLYPTSIFYYLSLINPKVRGRIHVINDCLVKYHPYPILQKNSPFTKKVSQVVRRLEESGIMEMWRIEYVKKIPPLKKPFFKLSMDQMFGVFCFLLVGYGVALFVFLCETVYIFWLRNPASVLASLGFWKYSKEQDGAKKQVRLAWPHKTD